jgi:hypothetical protein
VDAVNGKESEQHALGIFVLHQAAQEKNQEEVEVETKSLRVRPGWVVDPSASFITALRALANVT